MDSWVGGLKTPDDSVLATLYIINTDVYIYVRTLQVQGNQRHICIWGGQGHRLSNWD